MASAVKPFPKYRYGLFVSYLGHRYKGSQRLVARGSSSNQETVQEAVEWSLGELFDEKSCRLTSSSRTDKGVHALTNMFTLPLLDYRLSTEKLKSVANTNLHRKSHDIIVNEVLLVPADFHPRKSVFSREYIYRIAVHNHARSNKLYTPPSLVDMIPSLPVTELNRVYPVPCFNYEKAVEAIDVLRGEHDFLTFAHDIGDEEDTVRNMEISISQGSTQGHELIRMTPFTFYHFHFKARSFLHNQVRRMMAVILAYATFQKIQLDEIEKMLKEPSRMSWKPWIKIADPCGLFLSKINFDKSKLEGSLRTFEDGTSYEKVDYFSDEESDDPKE